MKRSARVRGRADVDDLPVQSFSDIAFLLIIFFILVTSLAQLSGVLTDLPSGRKAEAEAEKTNIVNVRDGEITMNDDRVDVAGLRKRLADLSLRTKTGNDRVVMLEVTGRVTYQRYYEVMTSIAAAGGVIAMVEPE